MPRQARTASGTGIYHIMMRGVNRRNIFDDDEDRQGFVQILDGLPFQYDEQGTLLPIRTCCLKALVDEPCNASCIDVDNTRRQKDEEVRELITQQSGAATEDAFQKLGREQQENIIVWLRDEGASVRQIVSHTGFTTKQVRNLTDKDKKKQAD